MTITERRQLALENAQNLSRDREGHISQYERNYYYSRLTGQFGNPDFYPAICERIKTEARNFYYIP